MTLSNSSSSTTTMPILSKISVSIQSFYIIVLSVAFVLFVIQLLLPQGVRRHFLSSNQRRFQHTRWFLHKIKIHPYEEIPNVSYNDTKSHGSPNTFTDSTNDVESNKQEKRKIYQTIKDLAFFQRDNDIHSPKYYHNRNNTQQYHGEQGYQNTFNTTYYSFSNQSHIATHDSTNTIRNRRQQNNKMNESNVGNTNISDYPQRPDTQGLPSLLDSEYSDHEDISTGTNDIHDQNKVKDDNHLEDDSKISFLYIHPNIIPIRVDHETTTTNVDHDYSECVNTHQKSSESFPNSTDLCTATSKSTNDENDVMSYQNSNHTTTIDTKTSYSMTTLPNTTPLSTTNSRSPLSTISSSINNLLEYSSTYYSDPSNYSIPSSTSKSSTSLLSGRSVSSSSTVSVSRLFNITPKHQSGNHHHRDPYSMSIIILISNQHIFRDQAVHQRRALDLLYMKQMPYELVDGMNPDHYERREELFQISGIRGHYPQLFYVESKDTDSKHHDVKYAVCNDNSSITTGIYSKRIKYLGNHATLEALNEFGVLSPRSLTDDILRKAANDVSFFSV